MSLLKPRRAWIFLSSLLSCILLAIAEPFHELEAFNKTLYKRKPPFPHSSLCERALVSGQPPPNTAFYLTNIPKDSSLWYDALDWGVASGLTHAGKQHPPVWNPPDFIDQSQYSGYRLHRRRFQQDFSRVFAEHASGKAYVMMPRGTVPRADSVFYEIEFPAMRDGDKVSEIIFLDLYDRPRVPQQVTETWWKRGDPDPPNGGYMRGNKRL